MKKKPIVDIGLGYLPPQCVDLEEAVLSCIIQFTLDDDVRAVLRKLRVEHFYKDTHQIIFQAMHNLNEKKVLIDILSVITELRRIEKLDDIGGPYELSILSSKCISSANIQYYYSIMYQKYLQRKLISICTEKSMSAYRDSIDIFQLIDDLADDIKQINSRNNFDSFDHQLVNALDKTYNELFLVSEGKKKNLFKTLMKNTDKILSIGPGTLLISGSGGMGKTSFLTFLMHKLFRHNENISAQWNCIDHDDSTVILRKFMANITHLTDKEMRGVDYTLTPADLNMLVGVKDQIQHFDIEFINEIDYIKNIGKKFLSFCEKRKDRDLNILVIDNVMRLMDNRNRDAKNQNTIDDHIANTIADIRSDTAKYNSLIIYLHHMVKTDMTGYSLEKAYRPSKADIKGSGRFTDVPEQVVLINRPGQYDDLVLEYKDMKDVMEKLFIVDIVKNSLGEQGLIYYLAEMQYSFFEEL